MDDDPEGLIGAFLDGFYRRDGNGLPRMEYIIQGSEEDRRARKELAALLRTRKPLSRELRDSLAALFDPIETPGFTGARELRFSFRGKGRKRDDLANTMIAQHVFKAVKAGSTVTAAIAPRGQSFIASAAKQFDKDEKTLERLWGKYRLHFEKVFGRNSA